MLVDRPAKLLASVSAATSATVKSEQKMSDSDSDRKQDRKSLESKTGSESSGERGGDEEEAKRVRRLLQEVRAQSSAKRAELGAMLSKLRCAALLLHLHCCLIGHA